MVIKGYGLNHQVNPGDLVHVQIKVKHDVWQLVKKTRHRSQVTSAGHCSVDKLLKSITEISYKTLFGIILIPHEESLHLCHKLIVMKRVSQRHTIK